MRISSGRFSPEKSCYIRNVQSNEKVVLLSVTSANVGQLSNAICLHRLVSGQLLGCFGSLCCCFVEGDGLCYWVEM